MRIFLFAVLLFHLSVISQSSASDNTPDSLAIEGNSSGLFYENLKEKANQNGLTKLLYNTMIVNQEGEDEIPENDLQKLNGKIISSVEVKSLDVFGPTFRDTSKVTQSKLGELGNKLHIKTNQKIIQKNILFNPGDTINANKILENERIIRNLPYIQDVRFWVNPNPADTSQVDLIVVTKDVFSFGLDIEFNKGTSASMEMYNKNIWGIGHQVSAKVTGDTNKQPYIGVETYYTINNLNGTFVDLNLGYMNTSNKEGIQLSFDKEFLLTSTKWAGGFSFYRLYRSDRLNGNDPLRVDRLNYNTLDGWAGISFELNKRKANKNLQLIFATRLRHLKFFDRPEPGEDDKQHFANSNLYLWSLSLSRRNYIRDQLVYSYGITEDIPKGYLHEWVVGYDDNEFLKRWYSHLYFSSGNYLPQKAGYLFSSLGVGGFFNTKNFEQGLAQFKINYISPLFKIGSQQMRQFIGLKYLAGLQCYDQEKLYLNDEVGIRGFQSNKVTGQKRLTFSIETVFFQKWNLLDFNFAMFTFADIGLIGPSNRSIFQQKPYSGLGLGFRIRNENLVFKTLQFRFAYYPNPPSDMNNLAVTLTERGKSDFYSFQAHQPEPFIFH